jgi:hypothetical protein
MSVTDSVGRMGGAPLTAMRAAFGGLVFPATRAWRTEGSTTAEQMLAAFDRYADELTPALFGHWGAGAV